MLNKKYLIILSLLALLSSCGPVNYFTRLKKTPREYSLNYCGEPIIAPRTDFNKELWIVFSDREGNVSYRNPGGKVKFKEVDFLQPFFVIKEKGEYLCLIKYDPEIVENNLFSGKIKDRKKAQYYGWMHKSRLLLTKQSVADIITGFKNKQVTLITDTTSLMAPKLFFEHDSIFVFKDPNLSFGHGKIPFYEVTFTLKMTEDREKSLVARKTIISPDSAKTEILGWVHTSLIKDIGQRLHVDVRSIPTDSLLFKDRFHQDTLDISPWAMDESLNISTRNKALKYSPSASYVSSDSTVSFKTGIPSPVVDQADNYVFNVNGNKITYSRFKVLEKELRKLNIIFVFEGREQVLTTYPSVVSAIQNLQPLFETEDDIFKYKFGAVVAYQRKNGGEPAIKSVGLTDSYTDMLEYLITEADSMKQYQPLPTNYAWSGVRKAVNMVEPYNKETNLLVLIGENGYSEWADSALVKRVAASNCRILGYQMHSIEENAGNNFVLQVENMIEHCGIRESIEKREKIVYVDQLRERNRYRESSKNVYTLDFPNRSMTQGWILFPEKTVTLPLQILTNCVDSLITEVKWDNNNLVNSLYKAFNTVGNHRYQYDSLLVQYSHLDSTQYLKKEIPKMFSNQLPAWYLPAEKVTIADSINSDLKYHLLLSKDEMNEFVEFMTELCANEVDYKYKGKKQKAREKCNCPDDDRIIEIPEMQTDSLGNPEYMSTRDIRSKLQKMYLTGLKTCKRCKSRYLKKVTLAEAQRRITGCPTYNPILRKYIVKDIKNKKIISDKELDEMITYFKQKREGLDKYLSNPVRFESNGQTYFWIDQRLLP